MCSREKFGLQTERGVTFQNEITITLECSEALNEHKNDCKGGYKKLLVFENESAEMGGRTDGN